MRSRRSNTVFGKVRKPEHRSDQEWRALARRRIGSPAVWCGMIILATGCLADPAGHLLEPDAQVALAEAATPGAVEADLVAGAFAAAMSEGTIRFLVRDAMRASLLTEHKLVLQEFVATPAGRTLVNAGAMAIGVTGDSLGRVIASLPPMDFYVPGAAHRKSWRGDGQVLVAAALARDISLN